MESCKLRAPKSQKTITVCSVFRAEIDVVTVTSAYGTPFLQGNFGEITAPH